ncbi:hypothetical protein F7R08_24225 [Pseudomonas extremorientalis]|nr:hypothetical protein F7R08_24225 [Pseudomonas extremorientalis]
MNKALGQGGSVSDAAKNALFNTLAAASFNLVGDYMKNVLADGSLPKVAIHAIREGDRFIWCLPSSAKPK